MGKKTIINSYRIEGVLFGFNRKEENKGHVSRLI